MSISEIRRLTGDSDAIELEFVERKRTPCKAMQFGIQVHLCGVSLSDTVSIFERYGVDRSRKAVHDWVHKADLQPESGQSSNHVALDETVIRVNDEQYWLYAAIDTGTNEYLHVRLFPTYDSGVASIFLGELKQNTTSTTPNFSSTAHPGSTPHSTATASDFSTSPTEIATPLNVSSKN